MSTRKKVTDNVAIDVTTVMTDDNVAKIDATTTATLTTMSSLLTAINARGIGLRTSARPNTSQKYRILVGGTSVYITDRNGKSRWFVTDNDTDLLDNAKIDGVQIERGANAADKCRPNVVRFASAAAALSALDKIADMNKNLAV